MVLFTLPADATESEADQLLSEINTILRPLPTVRGLWAGTPADTRAPDRPMIDDEYDVGLLALFDDKAGLDAYLSDEAHAIFAAKWDTRCRVRVFDFTQPAISP